MARTKQTARKGLAPKLKARAPQARPIPQAKGLDNEIWTVIFAFIGDAVSFRALEQTCKQFHKILKSDNVWKACFGEPVDRNSWENEYETYYRDEAFTGIACRNIQKWQARTENILLDVYGQLWKEDVENMLNTSPYIAENARSNQHVFRLRGDAAFTLACIVESCLIRLLEEAQLCAIRSSHRPEGHAVLPRDIQAARETLVPHPFHHIRYWEGQRGNTYVRRISHRAGITKLVNFSYEEVTSSMLSFSHRLALPAAMELASRPRTTGRPKLVLEIGDSMRDIAPYPERIQEEPPQWRHVIVPRQIEAAAERNKLPSTRVYGDGWFVAAEVENGEAREREEALAMYTNADGEEFEDMEEVSLYDDESVSEDDMNQDDTISLRKLQAYIDVPGHGRDWLTNRPEFRATVQKCLGSHVDIDECIKVLDSDEDMFRSREDEDMNEEDFEWEEITQGNYVARQLPLGRNGRPLFYLEPTQMDGATE
ncbi:expressed unknown protein [Seminavis robusta]|uniref:F-box domain-containing protein n=1 Tax=Seminavis robusta TaxID=568900 RepID=A0A9N8HXY3_9STRA|nr:expressed unknown protein [Seminavis robusta]|eukprot:Sro2623_g332910.1 n/a (483) ;mRNA; r:7183-8631